MAGNRGIMLLAGVGLLALPVGIALARRRPISQLGGILMGFQPQISQASRGAGVRAEATRTATASGQVQNTGNVSTTYRVRLFYEMRDAAEGLVGSGALDSVTGITLAPGATSLATSLTGTTPTSLQSGWFLDVWVILDITAPSVQNGVATGPIGSWQEPQQLGGSLTGWTPSISGRRIY